MGLLQIIYTSHATKRLTKGELQQMVAAASRRNNANTVTGMLYAAKDAYLQVLEGADKDVLVIYADILSDDRHDDIHTVVIRPIEQRDFPNWGMALLDDFKEPIDLTHVLNRRDDRAGVWNDASWTSILNTFRAELATTEP